MNNRFEYLIERIESAPECEQPFRHFYIGDFFREDDFEEILNSDEIRVAPALNDQQLFKKLFERGYKVIQFPGCTTDHKKYISRHSNGKPIKAHSACEASGITLRLMKSRTPIIEELDRFLRSDEFNNAVCRKLGLDLSLCSVDCGIQKYLDGYEISPHPDVRVKAATYMVNINSDPESFVKDHHTRYLKFKEQRSYVQTFWESNENVERCWVPWDWCDCVYEQRENNSIVIFAPSNDTLHAVRARYDHLIHQRTQLYGNLWFNQRDTEGIVEWEELDFQIRTTAVQTLSGVRKFIPETLKRQVRRMLGRWSDPNVIPKRKV